MALALILCRFLHFGAAMLLWGRYAFAAWIAPEDRPAPPGGGALALLAATGAGWLMLEAGEAGNGWADTINPETLRALLSQTAFGQAWALHLIVIAMFALVAALGPRASRRAPALLAGAALATLALVGHAAMQDGALGSLHRGLQAIHLLAAGFWLGGLIPLLAGLGQLNEPDTRTTASTALRRFSGAGHLAVALVIATGAANTALILGHLPDSLHSPYQALLALKIGVVGLMLLVALANRYIFVPRLPADGPRAVNAIRRGTLLELGLGAAVLALVSVFATLDPV